MKIKQFAALLQTGVVFTMRLSDAGNGNIQLDIHPVGQANKSGITLPPKSVIGTADELDESLPGFLDKYLGTCQAIKLISANADAELAAAEEEAKEASKKVVDAARSKPAATKPTSAKSGTTVPQKPKRDMSAGMMDDDGDDEPGDSTGGSPVDDEPDTSGEVAPTSPAVEAPAALDASLF